MADQKISALSALTGANTASGDLVPLVDISDTSMALTGTTKNITRDELKIALNNSPLFGTGSDGDATISADTTLSSDKFYNNLTVNNGIFLNSNGYRIFVAGTLTLTGTGTIRPINGGFSTGTIGANGLGGGGSSSTNGTNGTGEAGTGNYHGGAGGAGGAATGGTPGSGGTLVTWGASSGGSNTLADISNALRGRRTADSTAVSRRCQDDRQRDFGRRNGDPARHP